MLEIIVTASGVPIPAPPESANPPRHNIKYPTGYTNMCPYSS